MNDENGTPRSQIDSGVRTAIIPWLLEILALHQTIKGCSPFIWLVPIIFKMDTFLHNEIDLNKKRLGFEYVYFKAC